MYPEILPRLYPLRFYLETLTPFHAHEYKGAIFRGGFGQFFRDLVCVTRAPVCSGCPHLSACPYSLVFESPVLPERIPILRKYPNAPHPFVMTPPLDARTPVPAGSELALELTLIGRGIDSLAHFLVVFEEMGRSGRYGGRFRLRSVRSALPGLEPVFDGITRRVGSRVPEWRLEPGSPPVRRLKLTFLTPLRMRTEGRYNPSPGFVAIAHALLRRIHLLSALYGTGDGDAVWMKPLLAAADAVRTETAAFSL